jgi:hypothetical protein
MYVCMYYTAGLAWYRISLSLLLDSINVMRALHATECNSVECALRNEMDLAVECCSSVGYVSTCGEKRQKYYSDHCQK